MRSLTGSNVGVDELNKLWDVAKVRPLLTEMTFVGDNLVLGAETRLAKVGKVAAVSAAQGPSAETTRLAALLAAAHGRPIATPALRHIQRALEKKRDGDPALALIHLALSGLAKLRKPKEDARRLFMADALIEAGADPLVILKGLGFEAEFSDEALGKYNPDQPRVPAGNPDSGQWTNGDWVAEIRDQRQSRPRVQVADASAARGHQTVSDATTVAYPGDFHDQIEDEQIDAYRKAGAQCVSEVRLQFGGVIARLDILCRTAAGVVLGVEIKTGDNPDFTSEQQMVYPHTLTGGLVSSPDPKIDSLGVAPGEPLPPFPIFILRADGPGLPYRYYGPKPSR